MSMELHSRSSVRDSTFFFRIRRRGDINREESQKTSEKSAERQQGSQYDAAAFLYGFVFCRQRSDERLKRGGEQKSVVVLSTQPYSGVLTPLSQHAGPLYFNNGSAALQEVYQEVQAWEPPSPGLRGIVMVGAVTLPAQVPAPATLPAAPPSSSANPEDLEHPLAPLPVVRQANGCDTIQGTFFEADVWSTLQEVVERAWVLWELMILAQPLLVLAPSPGVCSAAVAALVALITPLPYSADFRPYFTIHDPDFAHLASKQLPSNTNSLPRLLGVTNLFFLKALPTWPNVLSTGKRPSTSNGQSAVNGSAGMGGPDSIGAAAAKQGASRLQRLNIAVRKRSAGAQVLLSEHVQALWHTYKPLTRPDRSLLERLLRPTSQDAPGRSSRLAAANSAALRQHFGELTCAFLAPFAAFWQPTPPPPGNGPVPVQGPPHLPPFSHTEFLDSLAHATFPPVLLDRFANQGALVALYRRFLESPNFSAWFERQRAAAWGWQAAEWAAAAAARGEGADLRGLDEVQIVEAFFELERTLEAALAAARLPKAPPQAVARVAALRRGLGAVYEAMPRDLQQTMLSSPDKQLQPASSNLEGLASYIAARLRALSL
ncbi:g6424 [Coccomyxa elongata]